MSFEYPHTCPVINDSIKGVKRNIKNEFQNFALEICPNISLVSIEEMIESYVADIYSNIEDEFETVRNTNEDMRDRASYQLSQKEDEIIDLIDQLDEMKVEKEKLEEIIEDLEIQLEDR